jgi:aerobic carbon-monoxide dehydrogenase medium subunit
MKPAPFDYYAPTSVAEALGQLAELGYNGKVLAGGQSLIPAMNFRMAQPAALVDLNNIKELEYIQPTADGGLLIGTMTRDSKVEHSPMVVQRAALICETMPHIAHPQIRNRGTFGGAMAHADPAGQLPGLAVALEMRMHIRSKTNDYWVSADDFFVGPFASVIQPDEMLAEVAIPALAPLSGTCYRQVSRQRGSQALVAVAVRVTLDEKGKCVGANIVMLSVGERPILASKAAGVLIGQIPSAGAILAAAEIAATEEIDPGSDIHATAEYRHAAANVLVQRALTEAFARAQGRYSNTQKTSIQNEYKGG